MKRIKSDPKVALTLFFYFFRIAWFTFGGGYSIIAQMQRDFIEKKRGNTPRRRFFGLDNIRLTEEQLLDQTSVGRSLPGLMIANVSYLFGYSQGGVLAGVASVCGMLLPPIIILSVLTMFYTQFRDNRYVARALVGVRSAVAPIIAVAALKLRKGAFEDGALSYIMCAAALALSLFTGINILLIIIAAAVIGVVHSEVKRRGIS
jgi:chromate transporter